MGGPGGIERDLRAVFERWADCEDERLMQSREQFERQVCPAAYYEEAPSRLLIDAINLAYTEWLLFEFDLTDGWTPLERFVADPPAGTGAGRVGRLAQVAETQFFSRFAIVGPSGRDGTSRLVDTRGDGGEYEVRDGRLGHRHGWREGTLAERIACVDGCWQLVGITRLHDRHPYDPDECGPGELEGTLTLAMFPDGPAVVPREPSGSFFLDFLRDVLGVDGPFRQGARLVAR